MLNGTYLCFAMRVIKEICVQLQVNAIIFCVKVGFVPVKRVSYISSMEVKHRLLTNILLKR
jgi:hypothetical protein